MVPGLWMLAQGVTVDLLITDYLIGLQSPDGVWELTPDAIANSIPAKLGLQTELDAMIRY